MHSVSTLAVLLGSLTAPGWTWAQTPTRIILFVADGGGVGYWTAAALTMDSLAVDEMPVLGLIETSSADRVVTHSGEAATAFATGFRSFYNAIAVGPDSQPRTTVLEVAQSHGMSTGLITTTELVDATPAAFASHVTNRGRKSEIARQMADHDVTVLLGGGRRAFERAMLPDSQSVLASMRRHYTYVEDAAGLAAVRPDTVHRLLGLFAPVDMPMAPSRRPSLATLARTALAVLDQNPRGFFVLIETEETDTQGHRNAPFDVIAREMRAFNETVRVGLDYQRRHPETLIIVLGDHDTGGLAVLQDSTHQVPVAAYLTGDHTANLVPLFASGPGSQAFGGIIRNDRIGQLLLQAVGGAH
jgi:alkaline phosphatase